MQTNILILSCGTRNKIIQYAKRALTANDGSRTGNVIATDMSHIAPAIYEADKHYIVSPMTEKGYLDEILSICEKECVSAVFSLIDPELSLLAQNKDKFNQIGTTVIGSSYGLCEMSLNKMAMYTWLSAHGYNTARSYVDKTLFYQDITNGLISYPVFLKPISGSASVAISKVRDQQTLELLMAQNDKLMIQEYLSGQEIGADVYIDILSGEVVSVFTKKKISMRAGETDKAVSFKDQKLFDLIERFCKECGFLGQIDIDIFNINGEYYISEVNPRFGGGYPHAYECGCDHMTMIVNNLNGIVNERQIGQYDDDVFMMKHNEISILKK